MLHKAKNSSQFRSGFDKRVSKPFLSNECCCSGEVAGDDGGGRPFPLCLGWVGMDRRDIIEHWLK